MTLFLNRVKSLKVWKISLKMGEVTKWIVTLLFICFFTSNLALGNSEKKDRKSLILHVLHCSLMCLRLLLKQKIKVKT